MIARSGWLALALALSACGSNGSSLADGGPSPADAAQPGPDAGTPPDAARPCTPAIDAGTSISGYRLDGWEWSRHGVLFEPPADADGDLSPALAANGAALHLFFARKRGTQYRIHHAVSADDGVTWTAGASPVSGLGTDGVIAYPAALHEDGRFRLWYGSGTFDLAESGDGDHWTVVQTSVLRASAAAGTFDQWSILYPTVARDASGYRLFYTGFDGQGLAIGRADSVDGTAFTRVGAGPLLVPGAAGDLDNQAAAQPALVRAGGAWLLWYGAYDTSKTNPGPYRVALATSTDGLAFTKRGLTLELSASGKEAWSTRDPAVLRTADGWLMVYAGMGDDGRYRLMRATSRTCAP